MNWGVLDLPGPEFLKLYAITFTGAFLLSLLLGRLLRPRGQPAPVSDPEELAYLAGPVRLADTVIAKLIASGAMSAHPKIGLKVENAAAGRTAAERAVLRSGLFPGWKTIQSALAPERERLNDRLVSRGLMVAVSVAHRQRLVACLPILAVMLLGIVKLAFGIEREKPVAFLAILLVVSLALLLLRMSRWKRLTDAGAEAMASAAQAASRLRQAPVSSEAGVVLAPACSLAPPSPTITVSAPPGRAARLSGSVPAPTAVAAAVMAAAVAAAVAATSQRGQPGR